MKKKALARQCDLNLDDNWVEWVQESERDSEPTSVNVHARGLSWLSGSWAADLGDPGELRLVEQFW